jgi:hypothetical protein
VAILGFACIGCNRCGRFNRNGSKKAEIGRDMGSQDMGRGRCVWSKGVKHGLSSETRKLINAKSR